ncbi:MAG: PaaI family thioesterase [Burkholderiales bacterium]|nr:PaaI family thioesterase [Burkholderiales bacterium]
MQTAPLSDTLAEWLADEAALFARQREHQQPPSGGVVAAAQAKELSGLQQLKRMIAGEAPAPPIAYTMDFWLIRVAEGEAVFQGRPLFKHYNPLGGVHGGWFATVLDSALGCAVHSTMQVGERYTTLELKLNLVRGLQEGQPQRVRAIGRVRHRGRQMASAEADLVGPDGKLYAHASTTCLVFSGVRP